MEKLMPIEPGCLCIIRNSFTGNDGQCVRVVRAYGELDYSLPGQGRERHFAWEIDRKLMSVKGKRHNRVPEFQLLRIDGNPDTVEATEKERVES